MEPFLCLDFGYEKYLISILLQLYYVISYDLPTHILLFYDVAI